MEYDKDSLRFKLLDMGYDFNSVCMFVDEYSENLLSIEDNIKNFKKWIKSN